MRAAIVSSGKEGTHRLGGVGNCPIGLLGQPPGCAGELKEVQSLQQAASALFSLHPSAPSRTQMSVHPINRSTAGGVGGEGVTHFRGAGEGMLDSSTGKPETDIREMDIRTLT
ncbi:hypothetical protein VULLAG_LOCUS3142 [Vulpes lagopus]